MNAVTTGKEQLDRNKANIVRLEQENIDLRQDAKNKASAGDRDGALRNLRRIKMNEAQIATLRAFNNTLMQSLVAILKARKAAAANKKSRKGRKNRKARKTRSR
jgi:hypothetical protein